MTETSPVESIDRALAVMTTLAQAGPRGLTLAVLADRVGVNKTTLHRALAALRFREFVVQDPESGAYRLGSGALTLSGSYFAEENLQAVLHPALVALSREVDELVHLGVLAGSQILYLDKVEPERPVRVWSAVGRRMPAATTALGRALLLGRATTRESLAPYLPAGVADAVGERLWDVVTDARTTGFTYEIEENEPGIACLAVPLVRAGATTAAVSVTAPRERLSDARMRDVAATVRRVLPGLLPPGITVRPIG